MSYNRENNYTMYVTVKDLIEKLKKYDENLPVITNGYEYGYEYLRAGNIKPVSASLPKGNDSDIDSYGGTIEIEKGGNIHAVVIGRST